jgi:hypothetical protein
MKRCPPVHHGFPSADGAVKATLRGALARGLDRARGRVMLVGNLSIRRLRCYSG